MTVKQLSLSAALAIAVVGCGQPDNQVAPAAPTEEPTAPTEEPAAATADEQPGGASPPAVKIANPASTNCIERGGKLEMRREPAGEYGVCVFDDGSRCEEWRYFRGECAPGQCREPSGRCE
jgi:putative hemolysin